MAKSRKNTSKKLEEITIVNPGDADWQKNLYLMWFDAHAPLYLLVWSSGFEDAFETAVDYLDEQDKPGYFTFVTEDDYREAAKDLGIDWPENERIDSLSEREIAKIEQAAEADMTIIGHTRLSVMPDDAWQAGVMSDDWGGEDVTGDDKRLVRATSLAAVMAEDLAASGWMKLPRKPGVWSKPFDEAPSFGLEATLYDQVQTLAKGGGGDGSDMTIVVESDGKVEDSAKIDSVSDADEWFSDFEEKLLDQLEYRDA